MGLQEQLLNDMKAAMKSSDREKVEALRFIRAILKNAEIAKGEALAENDIQEILQREVKKRRESIALFREGGRDDLVQKESREAELIQAYLPESLSPEALKNLTRETILKTGAETVKDMGKVMALLMPQVRGRADGKNVQEMVRQLLA